jgi:hypothetical protein
MIRRLYRPVQNSCELAGLAAMAAHCSAQFNSLGKYRAMVEPLHANAGHTANKAADAARQRGMTSRTRNIQGGRTNGSGYRHQ